MSSSGGETPLHAALEYQAPVAVVRMVLDAYPCAAQKRSKRDGALALHRACHGRPLVSLGLCVNVVWHRRNSCSCREE